MVLKGKDSIIYSKFNKLLEIHVKKVSAHNLLVSVVLAQKWWRVQFAVDKILITR